MSLAVVKADLAPLFLRREDRDWLADELLCGAVVEVLEERGPLCRVRTPWQYEGMVPGADLLLDGAAAKEWERYGKLAARAPFVDVLCEADAKSARVLCLPRGGLVHQLSEANEAGFVRVGLPDGVQGFARIGNMMLQRLNWKNQPEADLREALAATAMSYLGAQYRRGGKTPLGLDSSGLVSIAYWLNGAVIWRGKEWREGLGLRRIGREALARADVLYFGGETAGGGHVAMYLGEGMYIHATSREGSDGVVLNSLRADSPFYLQGLAESLQLCASLF